MRRFSANYIFTGTSEPLKNGIVEVDNSGTIINVIDTKGNFQESRSLEFYNGVIVPGFINTHCHLELSELKEKITPFAGLPDFIGNIFRYKKNQLTPDTLKAIQLQDFLMRKNGIVAVGDVCNTDYTIETKVKSKIYYHNFLEAIGLADNSENIIERILNLRHKFTDSNLTTSVVPHAPYSVSKELFKEITKISESENAILTIHNQESESENEMFLTSTGTLKNKLKSLGIDLSKWESTGKNSINSIIENLPQHNNIIFVHNTYSSEEDLKNIADYNSQSYWCLCPLSNIYIENKTPAFNLFREYTNKVTIGTDSLASNNKLSILNELKLIQKECTNISFKELLQWGTINGAKALNIDHKYGSIQKGKTPGINLITHFDFQNMKLTSKSEVQVLF